MKKGTRHDFDYARRILAQECRDLALLIGNGINYAGKGGQISWKDLMQTLVREASQFAENPLLARKRLSRLLEKGESGVAPASNPETFDLIDATCNSVPGGGQRKNLDLHERIAALFRGMGPNDSHRALIHWAFASRVPVLTTNYDHCLQDALVTADRPVPRRVLKTGKRMGDFYPWNRYYAPNSITDPLHAFAVWHIHGDHAIKRSIRIGLDEYMGMVQRLRKLKQSVAKETLLPPISSPEAPAYEEAPWLRVFMGKRLWVQGLGLGADEVSLRWLLIQRFRYWKRYKPAFRHDSGWYVHGPTEICGNLDPERRAFFRCVGIRVIEIARPHDIYLGLYGEPA